MIQIGSLFISIKVCRYCYNEKLKCTLQNACDLTPCQLQSLPDLQNDACFTFCKVSDKQALPRSLTEVEPIKTDAKPILFAVAFQEKHPAVASWVLHIWTRAA